MAVTTRNQRIRFSENNFAETITSAITFSSELSSFPFSNAINKFRSKVWKTQGHFLITASSNDKLYIDDGSPKTVTITAGTFTSPEALATQIQTDLNAASSDWTVAYDGTTTTTFKFTISNSSSVTLVLSTTTNAIWDTIGFTITTDQIGTSFEAQEQRNHTEEFVIFDLGYNATITFFAMIAPLDEEISISDTAVVKLQANNSNVFTSPQLDLTLTKSKGGFLRFIDDITDTAFRFWRISITDKLNPAGPEGLSIGHIYLGDFLTVTSRNINAGFTSNIIDPTQTEVSEDGSLFFDTRTKYQRFGGIGINFVSRVDMLAIEQMFFDQGVSTPIYISLDPTECISDDIAQYTRYMVFEQQPQFTHFQSDLFTIDMQFRELI